MGCVSSDRSSCSFDSLCHWLDPRQGLAAQRSRDALYAPPIPRLDSENRGVELAEQLSRSAFSSSHELFLVCTSADVYFSWHVLAGVEPPISHILIG